MPAAFSVFYKYLHDNEEHVGPAGLFALDDGPGEQEHPVVLATPDGAHAMGVFSPGLPQHGIGYGRFRFGSNPNNPSHTTKWNCVYRVTPLITPGSYRYFCLVVFGTTSEVTASVHALYSTYKR